MTESPKFTSGLWRQAYAIARDLGLVDNALYDSSVPPDIELPAGMVWVWLNYPDDPHWEPRGTGVIL